MSPDTIVRDAAQAALAVRAPGAGRRRRRAARHRRRRRDPARGRRGGGRAHEHARAAAARAAEPDARRPPRPAAVPLLALGLGAWSWSASGSSSGRSRRAATPWPSRSRATPRPRRAGRVPRLRDRRAATATRSSSSPTRSARAFTLVVDWLQRMISIRDLPAPGARRSAGWASPPSPPWVGFAVAGWRIAILVAASFASFGLFGYWSDAHGPADRHLRRGRVAVLIGMPLGGLVGTGGPRGHRVITPVLDIMQTMPTFVYLRRSCCSSASARRPPSSAP